MSARFTRRGISQYLWTPTVVVTNGLITPSRANITAAVKLTPHVADLSGWMLEGSDIPVPDAGSTFEKTIPGSDSAADSSFTFYEDLDEETLEELFPKGEEGFVLILRKGDKPATNTLDGFPTRVKVKAPEYSVGNEPARFRVGFSITDEPSLDRPVPAAA